MNISAHVLKDRTVFNTHVLKTKDGQTISEVFEYTADKLGRVVFGRLYGELSFQAFDMADLAIVPRAELLAGQVQVA